MHTLTDTELSNSTECFNKYIDVFIVLSKSKRFLYNGARIAKKCRSSTTSILVLSIDHIILGLSVNNIGLVDISAITHFQFLVREGICLTICKNIPTLLVIKMPYHKLSLLYSATVMTVSTDSPADNSFCITDNCTKNSGLPRKKLLNQKFH